MLTGYAQCFGCAFTFGLLPMFLSGKFCLFDALQFPGYLLTTLGAELRIEQSCFQAGSIGDGGSSVLLGLENGVPIFYSEGSYVEGAGACNFVTEAVPGLPHTCDVNIKANATSCLSSVKDTVPYW